METEETGIQRRITLMISTRAKLSLLTHDDLTAYYYGDGLEGVARKRNFRVFKHFFSDAEDEFGVIFPISVWDREWKIPRFSAYVEKLIAQPGRSLAVGRKRLSEEFEPIYTVSLGILLGASILLMAFRYTAVSGIAAAVLFIYVLQKKVRRIFRLKKLMRINKQRDIERSLRSKE